MLSIAFGFLVGTVCALARVYGGPLLRRLVGAYVEAIRNTPLLVQIFLVYFGLAEPRPEALRLGHGRASR